VRRALRETEESVPRKGKMDGKPRVAPSEEVLLIELAYFAATLVANTPFRRCGSGVRGLLFVHVGGVLAGCASSFFEAASLTGGSP
jgi:hypothetical protein